jgi:signal transduction histidine kinase
VLGETVEVLETESARLEVLARTFAQFGRLPEGPPSEIDVAELVRYTTRATVPERVAVEVTAADDVPLAWAQHEALARALSNVMLNAVDACADGGTVAVDVRRGRLHDKTAVVIEVRDTGCGIDPERLATIWEPYATSKPGGTGLGLAIARQVVETNGGTVGAESRPGHGTVIRFTLPAANGLSPHRQRDEWTALGTSA